MSLWLKKEGAIVVTSILIAMLKLVWNATVSCFNWFGRAGFFLKELFFGATACLTLVAGFNLYTDSFFPVIDLKNEGVVVEGELDAANRLVLSQYDGGRPRISFVSNCNSARVDIHSVENRTRVSHEIWCLVSRSKAATVT